MEPRFSSFTFFCTRLRSAARLRLFASLLLLPGLTLCTSPVAANPSGANIVHGDIAFGGSGSTLEIHQGSPQAIIDWAEFSIDAGETTRFLQPGADSAALNRVVGGDLSEIHGNLQANGQVALINPSGILVGPSGQIDVHGLVLSTLDVSNGEFLAGGDQLFRGRNAGEITNLGRINAIGGDVFLIGKSVTNSGSITASEGTVGLAAGSEVLVTAGESLEGERIHVRAGGSSGSGTGIHNDGSIQAAAVELKAHGNAYALAINNKGSVRATGVSHRGGKVHLRAAGGSVHSSGSIAASSPGGGAISARVLISAAYAKVDGAIEASGAERGGDIAVEAEEIEIGSNAAIDASGPAGGSVRIGGGVQGRDESLANARSVIVEEGALISADGTSASGDAGSVVLWSDGSTEFRGEVSAEATGSGDGGFVEVSGKETLIYDGLVSTLSHGGGRNGTLLIDPTDIEVVDGGVGPNQVDTAAITAALNGGNVVISTNDGGAGSDPGDITISDAVIYDSINNLSFLATRHILANASVQNAGTGAVNLVAGWDESTGITAADASTNPNPEDADIAAIVTGGAYGLDNGNGPGSVSIGDGTQTEGIAVGSAGGETQVLGDGLELNGSTSTVADYAQLGYHGGATGGIGVHVKVGGLALNGGTSNSYAQVGHGGRNSTGDFSGDILVESGGGIGLFGGNGSESYAQIGHGGAESTGETAGDILVQAEGDILGHAGGATAAYAQIGHGGDDAYAAARSGDVSVISSGGKIEVFASEVANRSYAHIGHGGRLEATHGDFVLGDFSGEVIVAADTSVTVRGGGGTSYAQIGHGGWEGRAITGHSGLIDVDAGTDLVVKGGAVEAPANSNGYAMIGHGGGEAHGDHGDDIQVDVGGAVEVTGGGTLTDLSRNRQFAQIGHGGRLVDGDLTGNIEINQNGGLGAGEVRVQGGISTGSYAQIGHGGLESEGDRSGAITVTAANDVTISAGARSDTYAQIGHGGTGNGSATLDGAIGISFSSSGDLSLTSGNGFGAYTQVGHGGLGLPGAFSGNVTIDGAHDVSLSGGGHQAYVQIGHGGASGTDGIDGSGNPTYPSPRSVSADGAVQIINTTGAVTLEGGTGTENAYAQIGHGGVAIAGGGTIEGAVTVESETGGVTLQGGLGSTAYALIGNGGYQIASAVDGDVVVDAEGTAATDGILLSGGDGAHSYAPPRSGFSGALIGSGGYELSSTVSGDTTVTVQNGGLVLNSGDGYYSNTMIGHSSPGTGGAANGTVDVDVATGDIVLEAGSSQWFAFSQIGHGGWDGARDHGGAVNVTATDGDILIRGGNGGTFNHAKIGHGGYGNGSLQNNTGAITVEATVGKVHLDSGTASRSYTQIGHGGLGNGGNMRGSYRDDITVTAGREVQLDGGGANAFAMIGHGGYSVRGTFSGDVVVTAGSEGLLMSGGSGDYAFSQVGHGGYNGAGDAGIYTIEDAAVTVNAGKADLQGGSNDYAYALVGNGGAFLYGSAADSDVTVTTSGTAATDGVSLTGGSANAHAMIGNGSRSGEFDASGDVTVTSAGGGIVMQGGSTNAYALIGNGGHLVSGAFSGTTTVNSLGGTADDGIVMQGGTGTYSFANIGHSTNNVSGSMLDSDIFVTVEGGGLSMTSSIGTLSVAAIGMQSRLFEGDRSGSIEVDVLGGDVVMTAGDGIAAHTQIGHGGFGLGSEGSISGDISLRVADGELVMSGGNGGYSAYAMIGSGSASTLTGDITGSVTVAASGDITLISGGGSRSFTHIGHGGENITGNLGAAGDQIHVVSETGSITLTSGGGTNANSMIGFGGVTSTGHMSADICVVAAHGIILDASAASGSHAFARIGHGGRSVDGDFTGDINVVARGADGTSGLSLSAGTNTNQYAQIGHGGVFSDGTMDGDLYVVAENGDLTLAGGGGTNAYAMFGHGDGAKTSTGQRGGGVHLYVGGDFTGTDGGGTGSEVWIFHQNDNGLQPGDFLGGDGYEKVALGTMSIPASALVDESTMIQGSLGGVLTIFDSSATDYLLDQGDVFIDTAMDHFVVTGGNITVENSYQNAGSGDVTLVAGWNGSGTPVSSAPPFYYEDGDYCKPRFQSGDFVEIDFNNCDAFGNDGKTVALGSASQSGAVLVGSRGGTTTVAGHGLTLNAGSSAGAATQLGFHSDGSGAITGAINVHLKEGGLALNAGSGDDAYAQVGHGGTGGVNAAIDADISVSFCEPGDVILGANTDADRGSYAQIGHGGNNWDGARAGDIVISGARDISLTGGNRDSYAQIGHGGSKDGGGSYGSGTASGNIAILETTGALSMEAGAVENSYVMIGNGGVITGATSGNIEVEAGTGGILMRGGSGNRSSALIGNGGYNTGHSAIDGNVTVRTTGTDAGNGIDMEGGSGSNATGARIGGGAYIRAGTTTGDTTVGVAAGGLSMRGGSGTRSLVAIGHGSNDNSADASGNVAVTVDGGDLEMVGGTPLSAFAQIGHGDVDANGDRSGMILVEVDGSITLGEAGAGAHAQIGHGGRESAGGFSGDIEVASGGRLSLFGGDAGGAYAQIGHGGHDSSGDFSGTTKVDAANGLSMLSGSASYAFTNIGHSTNNPGTSGSMLDSDIFVTIQNGGLEMEGGTEILTRAAIGLQSRNYTGDRSGMVDVEVLGGDVSMTGGDGIAAHAQIGHGGYGIDTQGDMSGDVSLRVADGSLAMTGGNDGYSSFAQVGHGGTASRTGDITGVVTAEVGGGISMSGGQGTRAYTQIGHGGLNILGDVTGTVSVASGNGGIVMAGGSGDYSGALIGSGGWTNSGSAFIGDTIVDVAGGGLAMTGGSGEYANVGIGHSGRGGSETQEGDIIVTVDQGDIRLQASQSASGYFSHARIGHGGWNSGNKSGDIRVAALDGDLHVLGGLGNTTAARYNFAQIGHGGYGNGATQHIDAAIDVYASGSLNVVGGTNNAGFALIGHGGLGRGSFLSGSFAGDLSVTAGEGLNLQGGSQSETYASIGHGGTGVFGPLSGDIRISVIEGAATFADGTTGPATLGHFGSGTVAADSHFALVTRDGIDATASAHAMTNAITRSTGQVDFGVTAGDLLTGEGHVAIDRAEDVNFFAGGDVVIDLSLLNAGSGNINAAAGWDGATGLNMVFDPAFPSVPFLIELDLDGNSVFATAGAHAQNGGIARIGSGSQAGAAGLGSASGLTRVAGHGVEVFGGIGFGTHGQIGFNAHRYALSGGTPGVTATGTIEVFTGAAGLLAQGGSGQDSEARVGHGGATSMADTQGDILIDLGLDGTLGDLVLNGGTGGGAALGHGGRDSGGDRSGGIDLLAGSVSLTAGSGVNASAQIGHGGNLSDGSSSGDIRLRSADGGIVLTGGSGGLASAQIGHGGAGASGDMSGQIHVDSATDLVLTGGFDESQGAFAKIGHGDDLPSSLSIYAGTGDRSGDIQVGAQENIVLSRALVGHVNAISPATASGGDTYVAPSRSDPAAGSGFLVTDAASEFSSADSGELRFYFPRRANNRMAVGTLLNGTSYIGTSTDPALTVRDDEYVRHIVGDSVADPYEHDNLDPWYQDNLTTGAMDSGGTYGTALGNYSLFYDTVTIGEPPAEPVAPVDPVDPVDPIDPIDPVAPVDPVDPIDPFSLFRLPVDDRLFDDEQEEKRKRKRGNRVPAPQFHYEGFEHYGPNGESVFSWNGSFE